MTAAEFLAEWFGCGKVGGVHLAARRAGCNAGPRRGAGGLARAAKLVGGDLAADVFGGGPLGVLDGLDALRGAPEVLHLGLRPPPARGTVVMTRR